MVDYKIRQGRQEMHCDMLAAFGSQHVAVPTRTVLQFLVYQVTPTQTDSLTHPLTAGIYQLNVEFAYTAWRTKIRFKFFSVNFKILKLIFGLK
jgi:hypothetical protein